MTWREAIETVLNDATDPMHYTDIAEEIATRKLRGGQLGATPANTVATVIVVSMRDEANDSPFVRVEAVLIEGLEPRQNRKRGDDFKAVEYLQVEDPTLELGRMRAMMRKLEENMKA